MSEALLQMAGVFSRLELAMIRARVKSGNMNASELARVCDLSRLTVYKYLKLIA